MRLSSDELLCLGLAYAEHIGRSLTTVGVRAARNDKLFVNLAAGKTCTVRTLERAADWFAANWPDGHPWPAGIPHPHRPCCGAAGPSTLGPEISAPANCDEADNAGIRRSPSRGRG